MTLTHDSILLRGTNSVTCHTRDQTRGNFFFQKKIKKKKNKMKKKHKLTCDTSFIF